MSDKSEASPPLFRPSKLPSDKRYEQAQSNIQRRHSTDGQKERGHYLKQRLEAKTAVVKLIPPILQNYKNSLSEEQKTRNNYTKRIFYLVISWLITILILIVFSNSSLEINASSFTFSFNFDLQDSVIIALITSAGTSLIGLLATIITYFFTKSKEQITLYDGLFKTMLEMEDSRERK